MNTGEHSISSAMAARIEQSLIHLGERLDEVKASLQRLEGTQQAAAGNVARLESELARLDERLNAMGREVHDLKNAAVQDREKLAAVQQKIYTWSGAAAAGGAILGAVAHLMFK